jgi:hypothetical protein
LSATAGSNIGNCDLNDSVVTSEFHLEWLQFSRATVAIREVIDVKYRKLTTSSFPFKVVTTRPTEATRSLTHTKRDGIRNTQTKVTISEVERGMRFDNLLTNFHNRFTDRTAWVVWIILQSVGAIIATLFGILAIGLMSRSAHFNSFVITIAGILTILCLPNVCCVFRFTVTSGIVTFANLALSLPSLPWISDCTIMVARTFSHATG